jgi:hypothetical protein
MRTPPEIEVDDPVIGSEQRSDPWSHTTAFVLLTGGITMVFLAVSTISMQPAWSYPAWLAPGVVALVLAAQRKIPLAESVGEVRPEPTALALAAGPFIIVLSLVLTSTPRLATTVGTPAWWAFPAAAFAAFGWWGYLYPVIRETLAPAPAGAVVASIWVMWHGLFGWAGANPYAGTGPIALASWGLALGFLFAAMAEIRPLSSIPTIAFSAGTAAAVSHLEFAPGETGSIGPIVTATLLVILAGVGIMLVARIAAVRRAQHTRRRAGS